MLLVETAMAISHGRSKASSKRAHEQLISDEVLARNLALDGVQPASDGRVFVMLRCPCCGSTLYKPSTVEQVMVILASHQSMLARSAQALVETLVPIQEMAA